MSASRVAPKKACLIALAVAISSLSASAFSQSRPAERTIHASKAQVEKALGDMQISSGARLPILEGFVATSGSLDRYQRGFYQYSVEVTPQGDNECLVHAAAKITAWYKGADAASSGYKVLTSNGRLESDLLDRLEDTLNSKSIDRTESAEEAAAASVSAPEKQPTTAREAVPEAPRPSKPSPFGAGTAASDARLAPPATPADKRIKELREEADNLEQILRNQSHPANLAIIRDSHTPIYARPLENANVVLTADAEDEFQILETEANWVHVQVSGLSRGWIQRSKVQLPSEVAAKIAPGEDTPRADSKEGFRQTHEETSLFPGKWQPLDGKKVKIIWVQPFESKGFGDHGKVLFAKSLFRKEYPELSKQAPEVAGIVVVFDSADGGMAAATFASLQQWRAGHLTEDAFWKQCWVDPAEAFKVKD